MLYGPERAAMESVNMTLRLPLPSSIMLPKSPGCLEKEDHKDVFYGHTCVDSTCAKSRLASFVQNDF